MRFKMNKPAVVITAMIAVFCIAFAVLITFLFKTGKKNVRMNATTVAQQETAPDKAKEPGDSGVQTALDREKETLNAKGSNLGSVDAGSARKVPGDAVLKDLEKELVVEKTSFTAAGKAPQAGQNTHVAPGEVNAYLHGQGAQPLAPPVPVRVVDENRQALFAMFYGGEQKGSPGGLVSVRPKQSTGTATPSVSAVAQGQSVPTRHLPDGVRYFKPYRAKVDLAITTDSKVSEGVPLVATITQPGPLNGWRAIGKAKSDISAKRFAIEIEALLDKDDAKYSVKGFAGSIDESVGAASAVRHDEVPSIAILAGLTVAGKFFEVLRKDESTSTIGITGTQTTEQKTSGRTSEAVKAGLGAGFDETKKQAEKSLVKLTPTLLLEKNTPILLYLVK